MLYLYTPDQADRYQRLLQVELPNETVIRWPQEVDASAVTHAVVWAPPKGFFARFHKLQTVFALGAGVDRLLQRTDLPDAVQIVRLTDAGMARQMIEYCLYGVLHYQRQMDMYARQQRQNEWRPLDMRAPNDVRVTVLGLGSLGGKVARALSRQGYNVAGWSRRARTMDGIRCLHGEAGLRELLLQTDVLFSVLPATPDTRHLLNAESLALLPEGAAMINAGRGSLIDEHALLARLDSGHLRFALLDVCDEEPLPRDHPFWHHSRVIVTPHVAAATIPEEAVRQIVANLEAQVRGEPMSGVVDRRSGY